MEILYRILGPPFFGGGVGGQTPILVVCGRILKILSHSYDEILWLIYVRYWVPLFLGEGEGHVGS